MGKNPKKKKINKTKSGRTRGTKEYGVHRTTKGTHTKMENKTNIQKYFRKTLDAPRKKYGCRKKKAPKR